MFENWKIRLKIVKHARTASLILISHVDNKPILIGITTRCLLDKRSPATEITRSSREILRNYKSELHGPSIVRRALLVSTHFLHCLIAR